MGLDMWLEMSISVPCQEGKDLEIPTLDGFISIPLTKSVAVSFELGYWRKFNALHAWFVENLAYGNDDCQPINFGEDKLTAVYEVLCDVSENHGHAPDLLPTQSGFFFGSTNYGPWYYEQVERSKEIIEDALKKSQEFRERGVASSFIYTASW